MTQRVLDAASRRPMLIFGLVSTVVFSLALAPRFKPLWDVSGEEGIVLVKDRLNDRGTRKRGAVLQLEGWVWHEFGLAVDPGKKAALVYRFDVPPGRKCELRLHVHRSFGPAFGSNLVEYSGDDGANYKVLVRDVKLYGTPFEFEGPASGRMLLRVTARNTSKERLLVVDDIELRALPTVKIPDPPVGVVLLLIGAVLATHDALRRLGISWMTAALAAAAVLVALAAPALFAPTFLQEHAVTLAGIAAVAHVVVLLITRGRRREPIETFAAALIVLILAVGMAKRGAVLEKNAASVMLNRDVFQYHELATQMRPFTWRRGLYAPTLREPFFLLLSKPVLMVFGNSTSHMRYVSMIFGALLIWLGYRLGRDLIHPVAGLVVALILAADADLIQRSAAGMRLEAYSCLLVGITWMVAAGRDSNRWRRIIGTGALCGATILTNVSAIPFVVLLVGYGFVARRWSRRRGLIVPAMVVVLVVPFFVRQAARFGTPSHLANRHATWCRNAIFSQNEFQRPDLPFPVFPRDEVTEDNYLGPPCTSFDVFFRFHRLDSLIVGTARGYWEMLGRGGLMRSMAFLAILVPVGVLVTALTKNRVVVVAMFGALNPFVAFLVDRNVLLHRHILHGQAFVAFCVVQALVVLLTLTREKKGSGVVSCQVKRGDCPRDGGA